MSSTALDLAALGHRRRGIAGLMGEVMLALVPGTLLHAWLIGPGVLGRLALAVLAALALEALVLQARGRPVRPALADGSVALAAWLLVLAVPPTLPPGQLLVGVAAAVLLGKHLYGGLGQNPFNPAMLGYAVLIVSFPITMTTWPQSAAGAAPSALVAGAPPASIGMSGNAANAPAAPIGTSGTAADAPPVSTGTSGTAADAPPDPFGTGAAASPSATVAWDAITGATPLDGLRTLERLRRDALSADRPSGDDAHAGTAPDTAPADTNAPGGIDPAAVMLDSPWPWVNGGFLVGGLWLLARGVIGWRIPLSVLGTLALLHAVHGAVASVPQPPVHAELLAGAAILGAFFIATDPVSAASGPRARLVYGAGIGALTFVLREFGAYPEGIAFAVLLMNATVPLLDRLSVPPRRPT